MHLKCILKLDYPRQQHKDIVLSYVFILYYSLLNNKNIVDSGKKVLDFVL